MNEAEYLMKNYGDRGGCYQTWIMMQIKSRGSLEILVNDSFGVSVSI